MRFVRRLLILLPLLAVLVAAGPPAEGTSDSALHKGNEAVKAREFDAAERYYADAEDTARDPGLVAFNKANALFHQGRHADAERHYTRALDDADAPPARHAAALYNRGVCQLQQGGPGKLRSAVDSFTRCLAAKPDDDRLVTDARHNLEVAKLLWVEALARENRQPEPNKPAADPPPEPQKPPPARPTDPFREPDTGDGSGRPDGGKPQPIPLGQKGDNPQVTDDKMAGKGNVPVIGEGEHLPPMSDDELRKYLEGLRKRVAQSRRDTAPPERLNVKDW